MRRGPRPRRVLLYMLAGAVAVSLALAQTWDGRRASARSLSEEEPGRAQSPDLASAAAPGFNPLTPQSTGATIHVTTTAQGIANDGRCSLQEAIYSANFDFGVAPSAFNPLILFDTSCAPGSGDDVIVLQTGGDYPMTSVLDDPYNPLGPTANPVVLSEITIEANGARLVRANPFRDFAGTNFRAFAVARKGFADPAGDLPIAGDGIGHLTIRNAYIKGFTAKGGDGAGGGGGGMGAGGAIYLIDGQLTVESCTFEDNGAGGGNGSALSGRVSGGGGGGLAGDGGRQGDGSSHTSGGGGGGSRGNGGDGSSKVPGIYGAGGAGGGTVTHGGNGEAGGFRCGGNGGDDGILGGEDGEAGRCPGGGGGGGQSRQDCSACILSPGDGGDGSYGGGGGGGGYESGDGGDGGFGGGGGAGSSFDALIDDPNGGDGGFGGGGGAGFEDGDGGSFGGNASSSAGGGGAGLGGAIFSDAGAVTILNSTFKGNYVLPGRAGGGSGVQAGKGVGGAIFAVDGLLTVLNSTLAFNESLVEGAGIVVYRSSRSGYLAFFTLRNTIIANSLPGVRECFYLNSVTAQGSGNLIMNNSVSGSPFDDPHICPGQVRSDDPLLGPLQGNGGFTPTMALDPASLAIDAGTDLSAQGITTDQRGAARPLGGGFDVGAYEAGNSPPTINVARTAEQQGVQQGAPAAVFTIATVSDVEDGAGNLTVTATSVPPGITVTDITNTNGTVTARIAADCGAAAGNNTVTLEVTDGGGTTVTATLIINVTPSTPPVITLKPQLAPFPNNHKYTTVTMAQMLQSATDDCDGDLSGSVRIEKVTSDEPEDAHGSSDGSTKNDIVIAADCRSVQLRAERDGLKNGRVYVVTLRVSDISGNTTRAEFKVTVPLSQNGSPAVQDATALTVNSNCP